MTEPMNESAVEAAIQAAGKTAARITPASIDATIASVHYFTAEEGVLGAYKNNGDVYVGDMPNDLNSRVLPLLTICVIVLRNGFTVIGKSACVSPENYDAEIGRGIAFRNARDEIWQLEGYLLAERKSGSEHLQVEPDPS